MRELLIAVLVLAGAVFVGWLGFRVKPRPFPTTDRSRDLGKVDLPPDLPDPVRRYFAKTYPDGIPRVKTAIIWGRARMRIGIWMPARFWVAHVAGAHFRRKMHLTWFGQHFMTGSDEYIDGHAATGPEGHEDRGATVDQGANLIVWSEGFLLPSLLVTDPRVRWVAVDDQTARLIVPFGDEEDELTIHFDPQTDLIARIEALRYKGKGQEKIRWFVDFLGWETMHGALMPSGFAITWANEDTPWSYWDFEVLEWNVDLSDKLPEVQMPEMTLV